MRKLLFVVTSFFLNWSVQAAVLNHDSLSVVLSKTKADSTALHSYLSLLARLEVDNDPSRVIIGNWLIERGLQTQNFEIASKACNELGAIYIESGNREAAASYLNKGLAIAEEHELYHVQFRLLNALGVMYKEMGQTDLAIDHYKQAITQGQKSDKTTGLGKAYYNLAGLYVEQGYESEDTLLQALNMCRYGLQLARKAKDSTGMISCLGGIASIYIDLEEYDSARFYFQQEYELITKLDMEVRLISYYLDLAWMEISFGNNDAAIDYCLKGLVYAEKYKKAVSRQNCYDWLAYCYEQQGNYQQSNYYMVLSRDLSDSLTNASNFETIHNLRVQYETEQKENEIQKLNHENEIKQLRLQQKEDKLFILEVIVFLGVLVLVILAILVFSLVRLSKVRLATNQELARKNSEIQQQSEVLSEQSRLISKYQSQMNPHFVFNALHNIQGFVVKGDADKTLNQLKLLSSLMRGTLNNSDQDFISVAEEADYLKNYISFEQSRFNNQLNFQFDLPDDKEEWLIPPMLIQPFIENAVKHAGLHLTDKPVICLSVKLVNDLFEISVYDNGRGFDTHLVGSEKKSHAFSIVKTRLEMSWKSSGKNKPAEVLTVQSKFEQGSGTKIVFRLPSKYRY